MTRSRHDRQSPRRTSARGRFVAALALAALTLSACGGTEPGEASGEEVESTTISLGTATANDSQDRILQVFAAEIEEVSGGRIVGNVYNAAQLGDNNAMLQQLQAGTLEIATQPGGFLSPFVPEYGLFELPFLFDDFDHQFEVLSGNAMEYFVDLGRESEFEILFHYPYAIDFVAFNTNFPVDSLADLTGRNLRSLPAPEVIGAYEAWGANAIPLPLPEVYTAIEQGVVDGLQNPTTVYNSQRLYEVAEYFTRADVGHASLTNAFVMSGPWFNGLSDELQEMVREAGQRTIEQIPDILAELDESARENLEAEGVVFGELPAADVEEMRRLVAPVWQRALDDEVKGPALEWLSEWVSISPER